MLKQLCKIGTSSRSIGLWSRQTFDTYLSQASFILTLLLVFSFSPLAKAQNLGPVKAEASKIGESVHLEFSGAVQWNYDVKKVGRGSIEINISPLDATAIAQLSAWQADELVKKISVNPNGPDGLNIVRIDLKDETAEFFDYLTEQPSRLIVDIYKAKPKAQEKTAGATTAGAAAQAGKPVSKPLSKTAKQIAVTKVEREPASDINLMENQQGEEMPATVGKGIFDGGDPFFERFSIKDHEIKESSIIRSKENVYVIFPMLLVENEHFNKIKSQVPVYSIVPRPNDSENELARFLVTLYERKRLNVYLKTVNMFLNKYPRSEYDEIIRFMTADVYFDLWQKSKSRTLFNTAVRSYQEAIERHPDSKLADRSEFILSYASYNTDDYLGTIRGFERYLKGNQKTELADRAKLGVARSFLKLKKFPQAYSYYEDVEKNGFNEDTKTEASYLKGDVAFLARDYDNALKYYSAAVKNYPAKSDQFPNAFYNLSESLFWKGKYKESLEAYKDYLKRFPSHPHGGFAMTRIGEILDILGADSNRVMGAWLETYFRYGKTPGASVARMRTLSRKMKGMKDKEAEKAIEEIREISKTSELPKIDLFSSLMIAEGYSQRDNYLNATDELLNWYKANPTTTDGDIISNRVVRNVNDQISHDVSNKNFMHALKVHNQYADQWLKGTKRIDTVYNLGRAFEQAGAFKQADQLFKDTLNKYLAVKGTPAEKERGVFEMLPTENQIHLRLAKVASEAGQASQAYDYLKEISQPELMTEAEQVERVEVAAKVLEAKGDSESAQRYLKELIANWKGQVDLVVSPTLRLAKLEFGTKKLEQAELNLSKVRNILTDTGKIPSQEHLQALTLLGEIYSKQKNQEKSVEVWAELLNSYEKQGALASIRYKLGETYFAQGNIQKAAETWDPLKEDKNTFWYSLGQEKLKDLNWSKDYKKYIQRIPAMAEMK